MGTDVCPIANCRPLFTGRPFEESVALIQHTLDGLVLENAEFLASHSLARPATSPLAPPAGSSPWQPDWDNVALYNWGKAEAAYSSICFRGSYGLHLGFNADYIDFYNPPYRYRQWLGLQRADGTPATAERNEWRRYFRQVARAFGGDRVIYLADNSHPLATYWNLAETESFTVVEQQLRHNLGAPKVTFAEVLADEDHSYFTDYFTDLS